MVEPTGVIRPQPRNAALGAIADALARAHTTAARVQFNPQIAPQFTLADLLPLEGAAGLMQDVAAYGPRALIKGGNAATGGLGTFRPDPRVLDVAEAATYASPLTRLARPAGRMAAQQIERAMTEGRGPLGAALAPVRPMNVMKPKGGNWLAGDYSPEAVAQRLKQPLYPGRMPFGHNEQEIAAALGVTPEEVLANADPSSLAINKWLDQKLAKYVRNEMATPEDPLRALIQNRGVSHISEDDLMRAQRSATFARAARRARAGFPEEGMAERMHAAAGYPEGLSEDRARMASGWETLADMQISPKTPERLLNPVYKPTFDEYLRENPWLAKVPPETTVYGVADRPAVVVEELGFDHLVDELRNAVTPNSGLPRELQLKPEQLSKVTVPQAVELVDRVNKWRAAQKAEAGLARSTNAATAEYKAYPTIPGTDRPNERGLRWVELRAPSNETMPLEERKALIAKLREEGGNPETWPREMLETALKYEGETMGHCVGGYCPDVIEGKSRIFSLRDARGEPHVTVEVNPGDWFTAMTNRSMNDSDLFNSELKRRYAEAGISSKSMKQEATQLGNELYAEMFGSPPPAEIVQIKGKANRAPKEDYLPFVQDFVKSQQWGRVGDLRNTGMRQTREVFNVNELQLLKQLGEDYIPDALGGADIQRLHNMLVPEGRRLKYDARGNVVGSEDPGYARGGLVGLHAKYAGGGVVKGLAKLMGRSAETSQAAENTAAAAIKEAPKEQRMLQGFYRGYAGENKPSQTAFGNETYFVSPQRKVGDYYAQRRAAETGEDPHLEMILANPFLLRNSPYTLSIPVDKYNRDFLVTRARRVDPDEVKSRAKLYATGGAVRAGPEFEYDPAAVDARAAALMEAIDAA